jgi:hypothetical protein
MKIEDAMYALRHQLSFEVADAIETELAQLRQDKARLDWLIQNARRGDLNYWLEIGVPHWMSARAAIDAAIARQKPQRT